MFLNFYTSRNSMVVSSGNNALDKFFGGFREGMITMIYGKGASGKSTLCLMCASYLAKNGKRVIYIDTEKEFSVERIKQIIGEDYIKYLDNILVFNPKSFDELDKEIKNLDKVLKSGISLIILDNISYFYKLELKNKDAKEINRATANQLTVFKELAKQYNIPIIITSQVYEDFKVKDKINMVGSFMQKFSKCLIEMNKEYKRKRLILKKPKENYERWIFFDIKDKGIIV